MSAKFEKVVYLCWLPLTQKFRQDYLVDTLANAGFTVEYWDLSRWFFAEVELHGTIAASFVREVENLARLNALIDEQSLEKTLFVMQLSYEFRTISVFRALTRKKCILSIIACYGVPVGRQCTYTTLEVAKRLLKPKAVMKQLGNIVASYALKTGYIKRFDFAFCSGMQSKAMHAEAKCIVDINTPDFERARECESARLVSSPYCVFIDICLPLHPDLKIVGYPVIDATRYYAVMNNFFARLEQKYNLEVVIAAHPKSNYAHDMFGGRKVLKGVTEQLVKNSEFVLNHISTAISYAVIFAKPVLFVLTEDILQAYKHSIVSQERYFAQILKAPIVVAEHWDGANDVMAGPINAQAYEEYLCNYLTSPSARVKTNAENLIQALVDSRGKHE